MRCVAAPALARTSTTPTPHPHAAEIAAGRPTAETECCTRRNCKVLTRAYCIVALLTAATQPGPPLRFAGSPFHWKKPQFASWFLGQSPSARAHA